MPRRGQKNTRPRAARPRTPRTAVVAATARTTTPLPTPINVIPGNPASNLWDLYLTQPDPTYILTRGGFPFHKPSSEKNYDRLPFHPDDPLTTLNTTGRTVGPARIAALSAFHLPYEDLVERLKKDVGSDDLPAPVLPFAYDWRYDTTQGARELDALITEVLGSRRWFPRTRRRHPPRSTSSAIRSAAS